MQTAFQKPRQRQIPTLNNKTRSYVLLKTKGRLHDQNYQLRPDVLYGAMAGNMAFHLKTAGVSYQLSKVNNYKEVVDERTKHKTKEIDEQTIYRIDLTWLNANPNFTQTRDEALPGYSNYYLASCPDGALHVKSYKGITLNNLYNGINLHYYEKNNELKHDYIVAPHADYKQIQLQVEGAEIEVGQDGSLMLTTALGKVQEGAPIVYQNGKQLKAIWQVKNNTLGFEIENYNPNYELIIDPITRLWGTYYGDAQDDYAYSCATDATGNVMMAGKTASGTGTIIATVGSHQSVYSGLTDAFLVKFNSSGVRQWGTYYGGSFGAYANACATDAAGNIYMVGSTGSSNAMATMGAHQVSYNGAVDAFIVKFNSSGIRQWGTYYGGSAADYAYSCITDLAGNLYIAGETSSNNGNTIATVGCQQPAYGGGNSDAFLVKFNSNGVRQWGTYYGGNTGYDVGLSCIIDASGDLYMAGEAGTSAGISIATPGSHQSTYGGGQNDAFLAKFNTSGLRLWGTYYGGTGLDAGSSCATDASGNVYLAGGTYSATVAGTEIATVGSHQPSYGGGTEDAFLIKFSSSGVRQWGTYYGGSGTDYSYSCATDGLGNIYLVGNTDTNGGAVIATAGSHQSIFGGGTLDAFLAKFDGTGARQSATYYGGTGTDDGYSCTTSLNGNIYMAGYTNSGTGTVIATTGSHQSIFGGGVPNDCFLVKFDACDVAPAQPSTINGPAAVCNGVPTLYTTAIATGANSYTWSLPAGWPNSSTSNTIATLPVSSGILTVKAGNSCGVSPQQTLNVTVNALPNVTVTSSSPTLCVGESATLTASGASSYTFSPGGIGASFIITPTTSIAYAVIGQDANGCYGSETLDQYVDACTGISPVAEALEARLFPNPTTGILNLESDSDYEITILNAVGQIVYAAKFSSGNHQINLENLDYGIYLVKVGSTIDSKNIKIIKD